jgi:ankyrin repeat protein
MRKTLALLTVITAGGAGYAQAPARVDFGRDVQPILRQQCYSCHGPSQQMNGFRLDRRKDAMRGGTTNPGIIRPGDADVSFLMIRITGNSGGPQMPPTGALPPEQIATLKAWIDQGAEWPDAFANDAPPAPIEPRNATLLKEALWGTAASVRRALDAGGDVNTRSEARATPLMWAVSDLEKTRVLLDRGANVNAKSADGRTALLIASGFAGAAPVVQLLLDRGAAIDIKAPGTFGDESPLSQAAYIGDAATFQLLLNHGADVNAAGPLPLGYSLRSGCTVCADALF